MLKPWPLHPKPHSYETLEQYVRRLAGCYCARYECFCLHALGIPVGDCQARRFQKSTPDLLLRLSDGTGVSVAQLEQMTWRLIWDRLMEEMHLYAATPEGQAEVERISNQRLSQNS